MSGDFRDKPMDDVHQFFQWKCGIVTGEQYLERIEPIIIPRQHTEYYTPNCELTIELPGRLLCVLGKYTKGVRLTISR